MVLLVLSCGSITHAQTIYRDESVISDDRYGSEVQQEPSYSDESYGSGSTYNSGPPVRDQYDDAPPQSQDRYSDYDRQNNDQPGRPYESYNGPDDGRYSDQSGQQDGGLGTFSQNEIKNAGHKFFGSISRGLANAIEYVFQSSGRPNGYILGEDAGGAVIAGLRYGEGYLYTRDAGTHKVYWQGPTVGYDLGAEGSKTMVLVYNLHSPSDIYHRFGGVQGSAYVVGGVSVQLQSHEHVTLAPIRSGVGLRLGANVGYLKYTRSPTWNPF